MNTSAVQLAQKYLRRQGDPESLELLGHWPSGASYEHVLCVPAYAEHVDFLELLSHFPSVSSQTLLILVVNSPEQTSQEDHALNTQLVESVRALALEEWPVTQSSRLLKRIQNLDHVDIFVVDRFTNQRLKFGVGQARKIAGDMALALWSQGLIRSSYMHHTDCDAKLPADYFTQVSTAPQNIGAYVYRFQHFSDEVDPDLVALYEIYLEYYWRGLQRAKSLYAYPSIGSCLALSFSDYCKVRGFPERSAGEDFHYLNKVRKIASVHCLQGAPLLVKARSRIRTPFGTSQGIQQIESQGGLRLWNPDSFLRLQEFIHTMMRWIHDPAPDHLKTILSLWPLSLEKLELENFIQHLMEARKTYRTRVKAFEDWFDALWQWRFIHSLHEHEYPMLPWREALTKWIGDQTPHTPKDASILLKSLNISEFLAPKPKAQYSAPQGESPHV